MTKKAIVKLLDDGRLSIHIPMLIRRHSGRKVVIVSNALDGELEDTPPVQKQTVIDALKKAHTWTHMLESGKYRSIAALARKVNLSRPYVNRILSLANLAPEIQQSILNGTEPNALSFTKLTNTPFPDNWHEQKHHFQTQ